MVVIKHNSNRANFTGMARELDNKSLIRQIKYINEKRPSSYWYNEGDKREFEEEIRRRKNAGKMRINALESKERKPKDAFDAVNKKIKEMDKLFR